VVAEGPGAVRIRHCMRSVSYPRSLEEAQVAGHKPVERHLEELGAFETGCGKSESRTAEPGIQAAVQREAGTFLPCLIAGSLVLLLFQDRCIPEGLTKLEAAMSLDDLMLMSTT